MVDAERGSERVLAGRRALVTGASGGLGADFARELAARGCDLVLVARRREELDELAAELRAKHGVAVEPVPLDLLADDAPRLLGERLDAAGSAIDLLVNNAGFGLYGRFWEVPRQRERDLLALDVGVLVELTRLVVPGMIERGWGRVLQVSSIAAFQPTSLYATYGAAKAFVLAYGEAINHELRRTGVSCTTIAPGITATEFLRVAGQRPTFYQRLVMMRSPDVARIGIEALLAQRPSVVPGRLNAVSAWSNRLMPRRLSTALAGRLMS